MTNFKRNFNFERSEDESNIDTLHHSCVKTEPFNHSNIQPPVNPFGDNSDVGSGNEEEPFLNKVSSNQLLAAISLEVKQLGKAKKLSITSEMFPNNNESVLPSSLSGKNRNAKQKKRRHEKEE